MASAKATFSLIIIVIVLAAAGVGGAYLYQAYQAHAAEKDVNSAATALKENRPRDAEQLLAGRLEGARPTASWVPQALSLRFQTLQALSDAPTAIALANKVLDSEKPWVRPGDAAWSQAHLVLANTALDNRLPDQAQQHLQAVLGQPPSGPNDPVLAEAQLAMARIELATAGKAEAGRDRLVALEETLANDSPLKPRVEKILGDINTMMLFALQPYGRDQIHILAKGDSLDKLSKQYKVSADLLMGVNKITDPRRLRIGSRIKIPDLQLSLVVDKSNNTLTVYNYDKFFKRYTVRTGTDEYKTPVGDFSILNKAKDPAWYSKTENRTVPPGDPNNELGSRWMGFQGTSLGIHEARDPNSLGKYSSNGCVGLARKDVEELFNMTPIGTPLKIQGQINPALISKDEPTSTAPTMPLPGGTPLPSPANASPLAPASDALPQTETAPADETAADATATPKARRRARGAPAVAPAFGQ